jgi:FkbM family methyltransferase
MQPNSKHLLKALFELRNSPSALPFNLNWQIKLCAPEKDFLRNNPVVVCDVGARGSAPEELAPFYPYMAYHAFDADEDECKRLKDFPHPYREFSVFPYYIGRDSREARFNLYMRPGESSRYKPNKRFAEVFAEDGFGIKREVDVTSTSLDAVYSKEVVALPDFLKLDTQGSELEILMGADRVIANSVMIEVEVEFLEMYDGQPLFADVFKFMNQAGFDLLYLNRVFGQRAKIFKGITRGQLIFGDALFGRREDSLSNFSPAAIIKYILLLINYGHLDFAYHLLTLYPRIDGEFPSLKRGIMKKGRVSPFRRLLASQIDKLALFLLHSRTSNRRLYDSDRSWPVR